MLEFFQAFFGASSFVPHGHCYLWHTPLVWFHIFSDSLIALAYYSISIFLIVLTLKRQDLPFRPLFWLFGGFIISCGTTHWMEVVTLWHPAYWLSGTVKAVTALLSVWTAVEVISLFSRIVAFPNIQQYELANRALQQEIIERQRIETALRESQELNARLSAATLKEKEDILGLFTQYAPAGIAMFDREMNYLMASQRWVDDYRPEAIGSLIGRSHYDLFPQIPERWRQIHQKCLLGATESCDEDLFVRADGLQKSVRWETRPWYMSSGEVGGIIIFSEDITERKQAEAKLKEQEASYRQLFENNPQPMWVYDLETLRFLAVNPVAIAKYGYSEAEFLSMTIADIRPPEDLLRLQENVASVTQGADFAGIWHHRLKDGQIIVVEIISHTLEFSGRRAELVLANDVTERKQAEMALQQLNAELEQRVADRTAELQTLSDRLMEAQEIAHIGSWEWDIATGKIFWSDEIFHIFRLEPGQSEPNYESHLEQQFTAEDRQRLQQAIARALEQRIPYELDLQIIRADGSAGWILAKGKPILNEHNQVVRLVGIALDITARKAIETQQERLIQLKDDFLSTVSHELRSPLASIRMAIEMLEVAFKQTVPISGSGSFAHPDRLRKYLGILREGCNQELELVNNLLDLQRLEADRIQVNIAPIDVTEWISKIVGTLEGRIQKRQQHLQVLLPNDLPPFSSDIDILTSVLRELLTNACKYTPPGETITVSVCPTQEHFQFRVSNSGVQIAQEQLEHIFDKFYRIPGGDPWKQGGTGLGLALIKKQVEYLGGMMWVETNELGIHFVVSFTLAQPGDNT